MGLRRPVRAFILLEGRSEGRGQRVPRAGQSGRGTAVDPTMKAPMALQKWQEA